MSARAACYLLALLVVAIPMGACAADPAQATADTLLQTSSSWDGVEYDRYPAGQVEISVLRITIPPHTALPWHTHPMPNAAYVLSGELTVEKAEGGATKRIAAGDVLPEVVNARHRGFTGDTPVVLLVFYAGVKGMPLSRPAD